MIVAITRLFTRHYTDNGARVTYVEWIDKKGRRGRTEWPCRARTEPHPAALLKRAAREGIKHEFERW